VPSTEVLGDLALLYTCQQIYYEASYLAYSFNFSITNRWHRHDLEVLRDHLVTRPGMARYSVKSLELVTPWAKRHVDSKGQPHYLDSICDFEGYVWNVLDLFEEIEIIIIDVPEYYHKPRKFAQTLKYKIDSTIFDTKREPLNSLKWKDWGLCEETEEGLVLLGLGCKQNQAIRIVCQHAQHS
jgi:hypothetical protein